MMAGRQARPGERATEGAARHIPVLLDEVLATLTPRDGEVFVDGTFGAGGYTSAILEAADVRVIAIDQDPNALAAGQAFVEKYAPRLILSEGRFGDLDHIATAAGFPAVDGVVLDIGVSSMQLDEADRGFSFMADGPLDMRMSQSGPSAADVIREASEELLADIFFHLGEERRSRAIARAIGKARESSDITTTRQLADLVQRTLGRPRGDDKHPATRVFQALRIYVNDELGQLMDALSASERCLKPGGRLVVVTFHSLEDRIVKRYLTDASGRNPAGSRHLPPTAEATSAPRYRIVNQRPLTPSEKEIAANPRARSARLRAAERTSALAASPADEAHFGVIRPEGLTRR
ncbi:16S rRNA (cytosine(1402)-N(4))-methyltransferase RsmH [Hyphomicrobium sp. CS1BSMeth3]|uniref:16S rRNA (cytosine(1402)-N(4))-methyltransferase RsmH n=1 Tax=Hyphomicrobium sp. CS1BSMeth3 TaxID=1892844 RepID=UPI0009FB394A|nr:16S rRNA (cytosine(1402)-N(4))-methyltransferase RsmH [Hyphomicrobium sp. CS1BSMeth3]